MAHKVFFVVLFLCFDQAISECTFSGAGQAGPDMKSGYHTTQTACFSDCKNNGNCEAATFDNSKHNNCYLHNLRSIAKQYRNDATTLYVKDCGECTFRGAGQAGPDMKSGYHTTQTACFSDCRKNGHCEAATFDNSKHNNCYLHNLRSTAKEYRNVATTLYIKDCTGCIVQSSGQAGPDMKSGYHASQATCFSDCKNNPSCHAATFDSSKHSNCYLHNLRDISKQYKKEEVNLFVKECKTPVWVDTENCESCQRFVRDELRKKRQIARDDQCVCYDRGNRDRTYLVEEVPGNAFAPTNQNLLREARDLIARFISNNLPLQPGTIIRTDNLRLDMQGLVVDDTGARFANLQVQINVRRASGQSTTIANALVQLDQIVRSSPQVLLPSDHSRITFPERYARRALLQSLETGNRVRLLRYRISYIS